ncbi:MAG: alpha/beta fold hydrolase [Halocynthiibacter sp.]
MSKLNATRPYIREWGTENSQNVLLLHCSNAHSGAWNALAKALPDYHLTAYDHPHHGRSPNWDPEMDFHTQSYEMALSVLEENGPMHLVGHSFGGTVALRMAAMRPDLVLSLTAIEPVYFIAALLHAPDIYTRYMDGFLGLKADIEAGNLETAAKAFTTEWGTGIAWNKLPEDMRTYICDRIHLIAQTAPQTHEDQAGVFKHGNLDAYKGPAQLISGEDSPWIIPHVMDGIAQYLPHARRDVVAGAGHMLALTHPNEMAKFVRRITG